MIKTHKELAGHIAGKRILLLNSLGKDSALCLEWLASFASPSHIVSVNFSFLAPHPGDAPYERYQKARYPHVEFINEPNSFEVTRLIRGIYQSPLQTLEELNSIEYKTLVFETHAEEMMKKYNCDYMCLGMAKYESVTRATQMYKRGLVQGHKIYPIGMMTKEQVINLIKLTRIKLHPVYKIAQSTIDFPSYYKMRSSFIVSPEYEKNVFNTYPLLKLDKWRNEKLLKKTTN